MACLFFGDSAPGMICACGCPCGRKCPITRCECECHAFDGMSVLNIVAVLAKVKPVIDPQAVSDMSKPKLFTWMMNTWTQQEKNRAVAMARKTVPFKASTFTAIPTGLTAQHAKLITQLLAQKSYVTKKATRVDAKNMNAMVRTLQVLRKHTTT